MNLYDYLVGRIESAGLALSDLELIMWDTRVEYVDGTSWVPTPMADFAQTARQVDVADVDPDAATRIRFVFRSGAVFQWSGGDFVRVDDTPRSVVVSPAMLRGGG